MKSSKVIIFILHDEHKENQNGLQERIMLFHIKLELWRKGSLNLCARQKAQEQEGKSEV